MKTIQNEKPYGMKYLVYLIIAFLTFLALRKLVGRLFSKSSKTVNVINGIIAIVLSPFIAKGMFILFFNLVLYEYHPEREFTTSSWQANGQDRYEMVNDLLRSEVLMNKSKAEISDILGLPSDKMNLKQDTLSKWIYHMGSRNWGFGLKFYNLIIEFENGQSVVVVVKEVID